MIKKLADISNIYLGQSIRDRIINQPDGNLFIIQIKDADKAEGINFNTLYKTKLKGHSDPRLVKKGDLLFVSRFFRNSLPYCALVNINRNDLIAAPSFYIISPNPEIIRPEYLHWYINSEAQGGKYFKANAIGSSALNIPKSTLSELPILVPTLKEQDRFIELIQAAKKEKEIMSSIVEKRQNYLNEIINKFLE